MLRDAMTKARTESGVLKAIIGTVRRIAIGSPKKKKMKKPIPMLRDALIKVSMESGVLKATLGTVRRTARRSPIPMLRDALTKVSMDSGVLRTTFGTVRRIARSLKKRQQVMLQNARTRVHMVFGAE